MTPDELNTLTVFRDGERQLNGEPIDWSTYDYGTMKEIERLRGILDAPIRLIRGAHPGKPTAIDAVCLHIPLYRVVMELARFPHLSYGLYSGNSWHVDRREGPPARWLAIRPQETPYLKDIGLPHLASIPPKDNWIYLPWSGPDGWACLNLVLSLAAKRNGSSVGISR